MEQHVYALIDIGNTKIHVSFVNKNKLNVIHDECFNHSLFIEKLEKNYFANCKELIIASVVPKIDTEIKKKYDNTYFITYQNIPMAINMTKPEEIGADRLVAAYAAYQHYQKACLIIDAGTALTFCYVDHEGVYQGGAIFPGIGISSKALNDYTAKIPLIYVSPQESLYGKTTEEAVQIGLYSGFKQLISGMINAYKKDTKNCVVIGTGTGIKLFQDLNEIDTINPKLIQDGLLNVVKKIILNKTLKN